ncbi:hypothetical protein NBRC111894_4408 [Sporolactobacillus inulinus]|uniref:Uncharacterized protein n=1 Tax=Sporolactobacillus inulinus TaxID=2078 RepID=A0A4Y1ZIU8_9BACL|nr:hypothetical protein NBRC111894_4408 [Sporolactobacillus inulinus]
MITCLRCDGYGFIECFDYITSVKNAGGKEILSRFSLFLFHY